ncbi:retrovirus-related pol polyprotein from transposon TNT 1-94 [Tanacetum coccineum]|uniref:Retrovirus-related pol polyprotein from transposon TNT 1-94 n=1 Tax=Tanacetum coccineum TaxID=301880 RepID=A0ABQ5JAK6_9ASTR
MQLASTINYNKSMVEEVTSLKKDFKQKENKYLEEFLDIKALKEKVAIGYKNPLCLTHVKQVQPALYNGYEIIKNNHVPALVHNTEDTLEIAKITRRKMNDKMKDPECVTHKVKIAPPDYSKDNYLATFTPQKQLTPEQIFWSQDLIKMKEEALKKQTTASIPIKTLMLYPPNTPAMFVPWVIPFFKILKEHFEGIQKALTKEIKEMKDIFEELEAKVDQNVVNRKYDEIEQKNILIANNNLIVDCLSKEVFYIATNSKLTISRVTKMHEAHTIVQTRCLEHEAELSKLRDKITQLTEKVSVLQEQNELFKAENEKVKQHYKELYDAIKITRAKHIEHLCSACTINDLARKDLVRGLPRLKFEKDHLCSACQLGKSKKHTYKPKTKNTNLEVLNTLHMDSCRPMRVQTIIGKKYILVIVDDYSRFTRVKFLKSKDETPEVVIKFLKQIQVALNKTIRYIRTDNGIEFFNKDLTAYYERVGIFHQKTVPRTPQQNNVVERRNRTLVETARTMLIFSKAPMFLWAKAVATVCTDIAKITRKLSKPDKHEHENG